jgi:hypothetical protein
VLYQLSYVGKMALKRHFYSILAMLDPSDRRDVSQVGRRTDALSADTRRTPSGVTPAGLVMSS